jgi:hypothetical protein
MSFLKKLLGRTPEPAARVRVCIECGMPVEKHAAWCAIYRTQQEIDAKPSARLTSTLRRAPDPRTRRRQGLQQTSQSWTSTPRTSGST